MRWLIAGFVAINVVVLVWQLLTRSDIDIDVQEPAARNISEVADAPRLELLGELNTSTLSTMRQTSQNQVGERASQASILCTLVGPFNRLLRAEYFLERLTALELEAQVQELEVPGEPGYWVYLPSQGSRKQAFNILRELQAKGIDSYVIPGGELENGVSFGMFSQKDLADKRLVAMKKEGYEAELKEVIRSFQEVWVVLQPGQAGQLSQEAWQQMMLEEEDELERRQNYCPLVDSE